MAVSASQAGRLKIQAIAAVLCCGGLLSSGARAEDIETVWQDSWSCGKPADLSNQALQAILAEEPTDGFSGGGKLPPFLVAQIASPELGVVLLVKRSDGWTAFPIQQGAGDYGVFVAPDQGGAVLFTMLSREGPGKDYVVASTRDGFGTLSCAKLAGLESEDLDYMQIDGFNADAEGHGTLVGSVQAETGDATLYQATGTLGADWNQPQKIDQAPDDLPGVYLPARQAELQALAADAKPHAPYSSFRVRLPTG